MGTEEFSLYAHDPSDRASGCPILGEVVLDAHSCVSFLQMIENEISGVPIYRTHDLSGIVTRHGHKLLYLFRDPVAVMNSYFHHARLNGRRPYKRDLKQFSETKLPLWVDHLEMAVEFGRKNPERVCFIEYQDDFPYGFEEAWRVATFFDLGLSREHIAGGIDDLKSRLAEMNASSDQAHLRGSNLDIGDQVEPSQVAAIRGRTEVVLAKARTLANDST